MAVPDDVRLSLREKVWGLADEVGWNSLPQPERTRLYEEWARDPDIGGILRRYVEPIQVRVYIKDSLIKEYARARRPDSDAIFRILGLPSTTEVVKTYIKPHGVRLADDRFICWGRTEDWKQILTTLYERAFFVPGGLPYAAILMPGLARFSEDQMRRLVQTVSDRLEIEKLIWLE